MHEVNTGNSGPKVGESGLSDEQAVKQVYPDASVWRHGSWRDGFAIWKIYDTKHVHDKSQVLGIGESEEAAWADARARIEAKPEPLPNTLQEEQFQQWLKTSGYKSESATCIFFMHQAWKAAAPNTRETQELTWGMVEGRVVLLCPHRRRANCGCTDCDPDAPMSDEEAAKRNYWAIPAPKVVDSKEEQCLAKQLELSIPGATSGTLIIIKAAVDVELKKRFPDAETFKPKVEEQDGEQELPPLDRKNARICNPEAQAKYGGNLTQYQGDFLIQREHQLRAVLRANKLLKAESVAPPSLPTPTIEEIALHIESESQCLMAIVVDETKHDYGVRLLKVMADEIRERFASASRAAAPEVATETDQKQAAVDAENEKFRSDIGKYEFIGKPLDSECFYGYHAPRCNGCNCTCHTVVAAPVALPTHQIVERTIQDGRGACLKCSCGRYFIGLGGEALAWASFEAHLPEKEGK